jgi:hypothetical protein
MEDAVSRFMDKCKVVKVENPKIFSTWEDHIEIIKAERDFNRARILDNSIHYELEQGLSFNKRSSNQILDRGE